VVSAVVRSSGICVWVVWWSCIVDVFELVFVLLGVRGSDGLICAIVCIVVLFCWLIVCDWCRVVFVL